MSGPDAGALVRRAIERDADAAGLRITILRSDTIRWASATFTGARHELVLEGEDSDRLGHWLDALPETDLPLRNHLVADLKVAARRQPGAGITATLEILTVEER